MSEDRCKTDAPEEPEQSEDVLAELLFLPILSIPLLCWGDGEDEDEDEDEDE